MNIYFEGTEKTTVHTHSNVDRATTAYRSSEGTGKVSQNNFALDISGIVMDNSAYAGHGRTAEEVMQEAGQLDLTARRNYMAVMSNSMSDKDFAKLQKEGFHPGSTDIETVVTIVDHIKAAMVKGGVQVVGYTDTLDEDVLEDITGSKALANELKAQFEKHDIPLTSENAEAVVQAYHRLEDVQELSDGSVKYMIENKLPPTAENLYLAQFSAMKDGSRQGRGYYAAGDVEGYLARKPETIDHEQLMPQIEKVIEEAGFAVEADTVDDAKWLVEMGIPLNTDTFLRLQQLKGLSLPETGKDFVESAAAAIADGTSPSKADLSKKQSFVEQAVAIEEQVKELDERAVDLIQIRNLPFNLRNLFRINAEIKDRPKTDQISENLHGRRMLEEVRLSMTVSVNIRLLRSGYQIETAPIEELLARLKSAEESYSKALVQEENVTVAKEKSGWYSQTLYALESIRNAPAAMVAEVSETDTLSEVEALGKARESQYRKAGESYETLMTVPRKDMGDSIQKAFRNVDDILLDMDQEISAENRKVIRILGYNSMEMTEENFEKIRQSAALLTEVVDKLKPQKVLSMIREGVNPLDMSLEELKTYLDSQPQDTAQEIESYSRFLHKLEQKKGISEEERSAYVGIYRLLRQIEKGDDAAVGAVAKAGMNQSLEHLLTAVRSSKKKQIDYRIDNSFGGRTAKDTGLQSITEQIQKGYVRTPEELEEALEDEETKASKEELDKMLYEQVRTAVASEETVLRHLTDYGQPVTAENLAAMKEMLGGFGDVFRQLRRLSRRDEEDSEDASFTEQLTDSESAVEGYEKMADKIQEALERTAFSEEVRALDVRAMSVLYQQLGFMKSMAREENFEIPVDINGTVTAINLKMIHKEGQDSKVAISLETESLGKHTAEFTYTQAGLSGYGISEKEQGTQILSEEKELLKKLLSEDEIDAGEIQFMTSDKQDLEEFSFKVSKDRIKGQTPDVLYRAAKAYIGYIQQVSK